MKVQGGKINKQSRMQEMRKTQGSAFRVTDLLY